MIDIILILIIILIGFIGFKRGFTKELICFLGFFLIIVLSFILKNPISLFMYYHFPFVKFSGLFKGITALNILLYEMIAFLIVSSILTVLFHLLIHITTLFEKILKFTIILGIPSKILGFILGLVEGIVWSFIILYVCSLPIINNKITKNSKLKEVILNNTPILTNMTNDTINACDEFIKLKDDYKEEKITNNEFDLETIDVLLKYKVIDVHTLQKLVKDKKVNIKNINKVIKKYEEV